MRIKALLLGGGIMASIAMAMIERASVSSSPPWVLPMDYFPASRGYSTISSHRGGSLAHRKWKKLRSSGRR